MDEKNWLAERFEEHRGHLRVVAYRMLGSRSEADDAVQEAWLRLSRTGAADIENLGGWLTTVVARVSLNMLRSRRARREESLDAVQVPEPIISRADGVDPEQEALLGRLGRARAARGARDAVARRAARVRAARHVRGAVRGDRADGGPLADGGPAAREPCAPARPRGGPRPRSGSRPPARGRRRVLRRRPRGRHRRTRGRAASGCRGPLRRRRRAARGDPDRARRARGGRAGDDVRAPGALCAPGADQRRRRRRRGAGWPAVLGDGLHGGGRPHRRDRRARRSRAPARARPHDPRRLTNFRMSLDVAPSSSGPASVAGRKKPPIWSAISWITALPSW